MMNVLSLLVLMMFALILKSKPLAKLVYQLVHHLAHQVCQHVLEK